MTEHESVGNAQLRSRWRKWRQPQTSSGAPPAVSKPLLPSLTALAVGLAAPGVLR